jgi:hypothetical protein
MKESVLNMFLCSYFEYFLNWLNICMDDEHFNNFTKLPSPKKQKTKSPLMRLQFRKLPTINSRVPAATCKLYKFL